MAFNFAGFAAAQEMGAQMNAEIQSKQQDVELKKQQVQQNNMIMSSQKEQKAKQQQASQQMQSLMSDLDEKNNTERVASGDAPNVQEEKILKNGIDMYRKAGFAYLDSDPARAESYFKESDRMEEKSTQIAQDKLKMKDKQLDDEAMYAGAALEGHMPLEEYVKYVAKTEGAKAAASVPTDPQKYHDYLVQKQLSRAPVKEQIDSGIKLMNAQADREMKRDKMKQDAQLTEERIQSVAQGREASNAIRMLSVGIQQQSLLLRQEHEDRMAKGETEKHPVRTPEQREAAAAEHSTGQAISAQAGFSGAQKQQLDDDTIAYIAKTEGVPLPEAGKILAARAALYKSETAALHATGVRAAGTEMGMKEIGYDMQTLNSLIDKGTAKGGASILNKPLNAIRSSFSDPEYAQLRTSTVQVADKYEKMLQGGLLSVAQLHSGAAEDAKKLLNESMTPAEIRAILPIMTREMENAGQSAQGEKKALFNQIVNSGKAPAKASAPPTVKSDSEYNALPSGATFISPDGKTRRKP